VFKALAWNPGTWIKQAPALFNHFLQTDIPSRAIMNGWGKLMSGQLDAAGMWKSPAIQRRLEGRFSAEQKAAMSAPGTAPSTLLAWLEKGMLPTRWADAGFNVAGAAIAWDYYKSDAIKNGMSNPEAEAHANDAVDRMLFNTAQPDAPTARGMLSNTKNSFLPFVWLFNTEPMQKAGLEYQIMRKLFRAKGAGKFTLNDARALFTMHVIMPGVYWAMAGLWRFLVGDDDPEDAWDWQSLVAAMILGPASGMVFIGDALGAPLRRVLGAKTYFGNSAIPAVANFSRGKYFRGAMDILGSMMPEAASVDVIARLADDGWTAIQNGADFMDHGEKRNR
jgi:hypothetical protein